MVKNPPANSGDTGLIPDPERFHVPWSNSAGAPQLLSLRSGAREPRDSTARAPQPEKPLQ